MKNKEKKESNIKDVIWGIVWLLIPLVILYLIMR